MIVKSNHQRTSCRVLSLLFIVSMMLYNSCWADPAAKTEDKPLIMGIFPVLSSGQIEKLFAPLAAHVAKELGHSVRLYTKSNFEDFTAELSHETYDIAFIQPLDYIAAHDKYGYIPVARRDGELSALLVVLPESPLQTLQDLKGKVVGLPPEVAAVSYLTRKELVAASIDIHKDVTLSYLKAHDACLNQLMLRKVDVCGSAEQPIRFFEKKWNITFRTLAETKSIPPAVFMVHRRVPLEKRRAIKNALLSWQESKEGRDPSLNSGMAFYKDTNEKEYKVLYDYIEK